MGGQLVRLMPAGQQQATVIGTPVSAQPKTVTAVQLPNGQIVLQSAAPPAAANTGGIFYMDNMGRLTAAPPAGMSMTFAAVTNTSHNSPFIAWFLAWLLLTTVLL